MTPRQVMRYLELAPGVLATQNFRLAEIASLPWADRKTGSAILARWRALAGLVTGSRSGETPEAKQARWDAAWAKLRGVAGGKGFFRKGGPDA